MTNEKTKDFVQKRPSDSLFVRLLAGLLLVRIGAYILHYAVRRSVSTNPNLLHR